MSDNARYEDKGYEVEISEFADPKASDSDVASIIEVLEGLGRSRYFKAFLKIFVEPRLQKKWIKLENEKDLIEMYQTQGSVKELRVLMNLQVQADALRNTIPHVKEENTEQEENRDTGDGEKRSA